MISEMTQKIEDSAAEATNA
jgi:chromosome segregation ATPase